MLLASARAPFFFDNNEREREPGGRVLSPTTLLSIFRCFWSKWVLYGTVRPLSSTRLDSSTPKDTELDNSNQTTIERDRQRRGEERKKNTGNVLSFSLCVCVNLTRKLNRFLDAISAFETDGHCVRSTFFFALHDDEWLLRSSKKKRVT